MVQMEQRIMDGELPPDLGDAGEPEVPEGDVSEEEAMRRIMVQRFQCAYQSHTVTCL